MSSAIRLITVSPQISFTFILNLHFSDLIQLKAIQFLYYFDSTALQSNASG